MGSQFLNLKVFEADLTICLTNQEIQFVTNYFPVQAQIKLTQHCTALQGGGGTKVIF